MKPQISIIAAIAENYVIGNNNQLIWRLSPDLKRFKQLTMGHHIVMGRKTFESIGKALPGRTSIIISRNKNFRADGCICAQSLEEAINKCDNENEIFIIGGGQIYEEAFNLADKLYITHINHSFEGDTFFPIISADQWIKTSETDIFIDEKSNLNYSFINYERIK